MIHHYLQKSNYKLNELCNLPLDEADFMKASMLVYLEEEAEKRQF